MPPRERTRTFEWIELETKEPPMKPQKQRAFTASRIVALAVIGLVVLGLGYLRFSSDASVSVPHGAKAGDLHLHACTYDTEAGSYAADCGTLIVPENRADPSSRLIAVEITRIEARSAKSAEPVFILQGGPGISNMAFAEASRYADHRDGARLPRGRLGATAFRRLAE
jgi:hypothetical protein